MIATLNRLRAITLLRYLVASALSLGIDMGSFIIMLLVGAQAAPAAAVGYTLGIIAHWLISSRKVFADAVASGGPARTRQKAMFMISALIGLGITTTIVGGASMLSVEPHLAKFVAIVVSFTATWLVREKVIFASTSGPVGHRDMSAPLRQTR